MYPKDIQPTDQGCLVVRANVVDPATGNVPPLQPEFWFTGGGFVAKTPRFVWDCAFWCHGTVYVGRVVLMDRPDLTFLAVHVASQPQRWTALPSKPTA